MLFLFFHPFAGILELMNPTLILASGSPRRRDMLSLFNIPFWVCAAEIDETQQPGELPTELVVRLSYRKAQTIARRFTQAIVIGADTVVVLENEVLGKPVDAADATEMLRRLRSRAHSVYSGIALCAQGGDVCMSALSTSVVWMRSYSEDELAAYVASGDPLDKAGAYGIQHEGFHPVSRLRGCFAGVMGLPLCHLRDLFKQMGVSITVDVPAACRSLTGVPCCGGHDVEMWFET